MRRLVEEITTLIRNQNISYGIIGQKTRYNDYS